MHAHLHNYKHCVVLLEGLEFTDDTVKERKQYAYRVLAQNEGGISAPSTESTLTKAKLFRGLYIVLHSL